MKFEMRFRQIHMDFHTSELIPDVGKDFDAEAFAQTLKDAHVDSVTCFSRGHHGWLYYDSKKFPELVHPTLRHRNLLGEQIAACHKYGIKVPVYTTVQWDNKVSHEHPEWLVRDEHGGCFGQETFRPGFYRNICLNTPYVDFLKEQIADVFDVLGHLDGLFLDILNIKPCACETCVREMRARNLDATSEEVRYEFAQEVLDRFKRDMTQFIHAIQPDCPVFYNSGFICSRHRAAIDTFTHLEIESLPGGGWGYGHFPATARYARTLGLDFSGMTGKFHTSWGDFGSFRNPAALEYECFKSLAYGGKCSIGDQLHPWGMLSKPAYELIGGVYGQVEQKEKWCRRVTPVVEAAVMLPEEFKHAGSSLISPDLTGANALLTELGVQFDVIDSKADFAAYRLIVLPDNIPVEGELEKALDAYIAQGGKVLASYASGLNRAGTAFAKLMPVEYAGEAEFEPDYMVADGQLGAGLAPKNEYVMYMRGKHVTLRAGAAELLAVHAPFFNRTWEHFCSHQQAPSSGQYAYAGVAEGNGVIYFAHPIFTTYNKFCCRWIKLFVKNAVRELLGETMLAHNGPSSLELTLNDQKEENRLVLHALAYVPQHKSETMEILEDVIPLTDIHVRLNTPRILWAAKAVPAGAEIPLTKTAHGYEFVIPRVEGHQMIELDY